MLTIYVVVGNDRKKTHADGGFQKVLFFHNKSNAIKFCGEANRAKNELFYSWYECEFTI